MDKSISRILCLLLCICIVLCNLPAVFAGEDVIEIGSVEEFLAFAENCRLDSYSRGETFRLTADIDLTGTDFSGIPVFGGTLEGNDHIISGLAIHDAGSVKGLFRYLESTATVSNLIVKGTIAPTVSRTDIGGIAGSNAGVIINCTFSGQVTGGENVGGIAGINLAGARIEACKTEGAISGKHFTGGITGSNAGIVADCTNEANVNITAQQNEIDISDITLGTLTNTESSAATTDIGGIAGYSEGILRGCINYGAVGYKHMGYNVGGIAGLQTGYVADCQNFGAISGRKEVGGIVGQQEPEVVLHYTTDTIQILKGEFGVLSERIKELSANAGSNSSNIRNQLYKLEKYVSKAETAIEYLETSLEEPKFEELESYLDALKTIRDSIEGIESTMRKLWDAVDEAVSDFDRDMKAVEAQLLVIENTLNNAEDNLGGQVLDISDQDTPEDLISKVENCQNAGAVLGDLNVGGIVGIVSFENDLDPEEDITVVGDTTLNAIGSLRSVILSCTNTGSVNAKNSRIGGIAGWMSMGLIKDCINTGAVENSTADYVGGIVGDSNGFIRGCMVKCKVVGDMYVGGIAGRGSIASNCYAMVQTSGTERVGAIFGLAQEPQSQTEAPICNNFYLIHDVDTGAVDGISYDTMAQGLPLESFVQLQPEDSIFSSVTITFIANGQVIQQLTQNAGSALETLPEVPAIAGSTGVWEGIGEFDLSCILFDLTIYASYTAYSSVIESDATGQNGRPVMLLQGDFATGAKLFVTTLENFGALQEGQILIQGLAFSTENCVSAHVGRLLLPADLNTENVILLVRDGNGNWVERTYRTADSYIVFSLSNGDDAVALIEVPSESVFTPEVFIAAGVGAITVLLIVLVCILIAKRVKKRKVAVSYSDADEEEA